MIASSAVIKTYEVNYMKRKTYESFHANILIRKDQFEAVREISDRKSISISALVRMLLDDYLKGDLEHENKKKIG
jgi:hypothetical protein